MEESNTKKSQVKFSEAGTYTVCKALSIVNQDRESVSKSVLYQRSKNN